MLAGYKNSQEIVVVEEYRKWKTEKKGWIKNKKQ